MGTQGAAGRKRASAKDYIFSPEDDALHKISVEAEAKLAAKRAARAEAREIRLRELERQKRREDDAEKHHRRQRRQQQLEPNGQGSTSGHGSGSRQSHNHESRSLYTGGGGKSISHKRDPLPVPTLGRDYSKGDPGQKRTSRSGVPSSSAGLSLGGLGSRYLSSSTYSLHRPSYLSSDPVTTASNYKPWEYSLPSSSRSSSRATSRSSSTRQSPTPWEYSLPSSSRSSSRATSRSSSARQSPTGSQDSSDGRSVADFFGSASRRSSVSSAVSDFDINGAALFGGDIGRALLSDGSISSAASSRRGSEDTACSVGTESSIQELRDIFELKDELHGVEERYMQKLKEMKEATDGAQEKYKKAMVSNAQLDNEKAALSYQVEVLREALEDVEEQSAEARRELSDARSDAERQRQASASAQHKLEEARDALHQREERVQEIPSLQRKEDALAREVFDLRETVNWKEKKITALERQKEYYECIRAERDELRAEVALLREKTKLSLGVAVNGDEFDAARDSGMLDHVAPTAAEAAVLDVRLKRLTEENDALLDELRRTSQQLEEERRCRARVEVAFARPSPSELEDDFYLRDLQRETNKHLSEYKYKLAKSEQEKATLEKNILRLQGQISRHKAAADGAEKEEDELKADRRRLQRELHMALEKLDEMETTNNHLMMRLSKLKAKRDMAYAQQ
uniref:Leucine-rich repeat flightless-interacting protein 2-like isoform X2 n=1 Tax=Petromyzon marinus TaxID=7757 RepID=A0AAJ7TVE1_PETMA|nr:leucine-rich repeat flightless-interacting protein 2-like isoform X2 [Petromyzon marinus]